MSQEQSVYGGTPSSIEVSKSLIGLHFPATRDDIIAHAENRRSESRIVDVLHRLPERDYNDFDDVMQHYAEIT